MEALGTASAAAGLISLGINVCHGLIAYYSAWKGADNAINNMCESVEGLTKTFLGLKRAIIKPTLDKDAVKQMKESVESCRP